MSDLQTPDVSIIIVNWNVRDLLRACLASLTKDEGRRTKDESEPSYVFRPSSLEIIVVDNASADGSAEMVAAEFPEVKLVANPDNRGFTRGNNQGLALAQGRYVLFLNPDTVVMGDALATMIAYLDAHPEVGALGPELRYGDGSRQSSRRRFPTLLTALLESTPLAWHWPAKLNPWARRYHMVDARILKGSQTSKIFPGEKVDWLVGAALMVRRTTLEQIGGFDEGYFMYSEELDWCRRAKDAGWWIIYLPTAQIIHYEGKSSEQVVAARHIRFNTSKVRYFRKFHGPLAAGVLRFALLGMFGVEWLIEAGKWLFGSKRSLRHKRMIAYAELLTSGLRSDK